MTMATPVKNSSNSSTPTTIGTATTSAGYQLRKRGSCEQCGHKHMGGRYCHVFVSAFPHDDPSSPFLPSSTTTSRRQQMESTGYLPTSAYEDWLDDDADIPGKEVKKAGGGFMEDFLQRGGGGDGGGFFGKFHHHKARGGRGGASEEEGGGEGGEGGDYSGLPAEGEGGAVNDAEAMTMMQQQQPPQEPTAPAGWAGGGVAAEGADSGGGGGEYYGQVEEAQRLWWGGEGDTDAVQQQQREREEGQEGGCYYNYHYNEEGYYEQQEEGEEGGADATAVYGDELNVPAWAVGCFARCGCRYGVPAKSRAYSAVQETRYVGDILINMGHSQEEYPYSGQGGGPPGEYLGYIYTFLSPGDIGRAAVAGRCFLDHVWRDPQYADVCQMSAVSSFEAHDDYVEAMVYREGLLYTCGERKCKLWDPNTGQCVKVVFRDQTNIVALCLEEPRFFYSFMANGTFRKWKVTFKPEVMEFSALFGEHCGRINDMLLSPPSEGHCKRHTMLRHSCFLYTCSDDRTTKVWDTSTNVCLATITPPSHRSSTIRSMALSSRHIFLGSSRGQIFVYSLHRVCERTDIHNCHDPLIGPQRFCHQCTLTHGDSIIRCLTTAGPTYTKTFLFSGSVDGSISVWRLPPGEEGQAGGLVFQLYALWKGAHKGAVNAFAVSWNHLYSASADSFIKVWKLSNSPALVRAVAGNGQAIKSLCVVEGQGGGEGRVLAGLSTGLVVSVRIGTYG